MESTKNSDLKMLRCLQIIFLCYFLNGINEAESHCSPSEGYKSFICQNLSSLSELDLSNSAEILTIENSKIHSIPANYFPSKFPNLYNLKMEDQGLEEISPEAFSGLDMGKLILKKNFITALHSLNGNFDEVDFSENKITSIDQETFSSASNLQMLYLMENRLENLGPGLFKHSSKLLRLDLSKNQIRVVDQNAFEGAENLQILNLSDNQISDLSPDTFSKSPNLFLLNLTQNYLTVIREKWFSPNFKDTLNFYAAHNRIKSIEPNTFKNTTKLGKVDLSHNELSDITGLCARAVIVNHNQLTDEDADSVIRCPKLRTLYMEHNKIKKLKLQNFENTSLSEFSFAHNEIEDFNLSILSKLKDGYLVNLNHNQIKKLHENVGGVIKLMELHLEHNKIEQIGKDTFKTFLELEYLKIRLAHNAIKTISPGGLNTFVPVVPEGNKSSNFELFLEHNDLNTFGNWFEDGSSVQYLNVSHSKIKKVESDSLKGAHFLSDLDLSHNEISQLSQNSFVSSKLERLFLGHNQLTVLANDVVVNCTKLTMLDFSFNNIETIEPNALKNLKNLQKFYIQNNRLTTFSDSIFAGFSHLNYVNVSSNALQTISMSEDLKSFTLDFANNKLKSVSDDVVLKSSPYGKLASRFRSDKIVKTGILGL